MDGDPVELDREKALFGEITVWFDESLEAPIKTTCWGESTDIAAAVLSAFEDDSVAAIAVSLVRGIPEDEVLEPRKSDPRND